MPDSIAQSSATTPEITLIVPSYREEENLRLLFPRLKEVLKQTGMSHEIMVVDTQKPLDKTEDVCREYSVRYVPCQEPDSYGAAVRTGIREAQGKYIVFMDADGSHAPEYIPEILKFRDEADVVGASRYVEGGDNENARVLIMMSWIVNFVYSFVLGLNCKDVSNSFKLYKAAQLKTLKLHCGNFDIIEEILFKLNRRFKIKIKEIPFTFKKRKFGESKRNLFVFMMTYFFTLLKLRFGRED
jgi:dolichol-phosphate mannosyltransferase